jgi:cell division transport system permease protein
VKLKDTKINKLQLRSSYFTSIISIALVLFIIGLLLFLVMNAKKLSDSVKENIGFSVLLNEPAKEADIIRLQKELDAKPFVRSTKYITKEESAKQLQNDLGEDFVNFLGYNPLPISIDVKMIASYANSDSLTIIEKKLQQNPLVKEVLYQKSLVHLINENIRKISIILLAFSALLFIIAIALINNTIRLSIYARRFLIRTMQLVGATRSFIRKPFLYKSILHGIYASIIAYCLLGSLVYIGRQELPELIDFQNIEVFILVFAFILIIGVSITVICTFFAINKFLGLTQDELYY